MISDLRDLVQFPYLEELICDNNDLSEESHFPTLNNLKIFSCNKNKVWILLDLFNLKKVKRLKTIIKIENIHIFVDKIKISFPNLTYLSMLGNKACPNQLIDSSNDEYDYTRYRKYMIYRLKNLKFLDCYEIGKEEREQITSDERFFDVVKLDLPEKNTSAKIENDKTETKSYSYSSLPAKITDTDDKTPQGKLRKINSILLNLLIIVLK